MGLDISSYRQIQLVPDANIDQDSDGYRDDLLVITPSILQWTEKNWPGRTEGLKAGGYASKEADGFHAGSYGGYNSWRRELALAAHAVNPEAIWEKNDKGEGGPFFELINFADNEGVIGPVVSKKLAEDFRTHRDAIFAKVGDEPLWFKALYDKWAAAFAMAADGGCVEFH